MTIATGPLAEVPLDGKADVPGANDAARIMSALRGG